MRCASELRTYERRIEPRRRPGDQIPEVYIASLRRHAEEHGGWLSVAEIDGRVAGFVYAFKTEVLDDQTNEPAIMVSISDLVVGQKFARLGVDQLLIDAAEQIARREGARTITVGVQANHQAALDFYGRHGYESHELILMKHLE